MKKSFLLIFAFSLLLISCDESFNPYGDFKEQYILNCVLYCDSTYQTAVLLRNYPPDEFGNQDISSLFVTNADVRIWMGDSVYRMKDSVIYNDDFPNGYRFYYAANSLIALNQEIEIQALLENGKRLTAVSRSPKEILFKNTSDVIIPPVSSSLVKFFWDPVGQSNYYQPRLRVKYSRIINGLNKIFFADVPIRYEEINGVQSPVYPLPSNQTAINYELNLITRFLNDLSGDLSKSEISIYQNLEFDVIACDENLSKYLSSTNNSLNTLSVRADENDYSNVSGGIGIFGSAAKKNYPQIRFLESYITGLGYNFVNEN